MTSAGSTQTAGNVVIAAVAPAVFTTNGNALLVVELTRIPSPARTTAEEMALITNADGGYTAAPINMGAATDKVYLSFYATGVQAA